MAVRSPGPWSPDLLRPSPALVVASSEPPRTTGPFLRRSPVEPAMDKDATIENDSAGGPRVARRDDRRRAVHRLTAGEQLGACRRGGLHVDHRPSHFRSSRPCPWLAPQGFAGGRDRWCVVARMRPPRGLEKDGGGQETMVPGSARPYTRMWARVWSASAIDRPMNRASVGYRLQPIVI